MLQISLLPLYKRRHRWANGYRLMRRNPVRRLEPLHFISASVGGLFALLACSVSAQNPLPTPGIPTEAEAERVVVTGSNIPTAEEVGPNPVDTYRPEDIEKLGARNTTDLLTKLPQEMGSTINQNHTGVGGGDGSVIPNLRGLLPKETLVLIDVKRAAIIGSGGGVAAGASPGVAGVDINLIPFPMIDHIDILKDGASAIYGSDAVAGVFNIFLKHKFRDVEIGSSIGNTNLGSSNDARELETWMIAGTGNDKTDIVIIADTYDKYLTVFADFKYTRSFFDGAGAAPGFFPDPFKQTNGAAFSPNGISVPIANPFNPFTAPDAHLPDGTPVTTGVHFAGIRDTGGSTFKTTFYDILFDAGLRGQMGEFGDYFKNWNWEAGFRYSLNEEDTVTDGVVSAAALREALLDRDPVTAFNPFLGYR